MFGSKSKQLEIATRLAQEERQMREYQKELDRTREERLREYQKELDRTREQRDIINKQYNAKCDSKVTSNNNSDQDNMKINACVFASLVVFFVGFFTEFTYEKPLHVVLSVPIFNIFAITTCSYFARYVFTDLVKRSILTILWQYSTGILVRYMMVSKGDYNYLVEQNPMNLWILIFIMIVIYVIAYNYLFEITKPPHLRWKKTD